MKSMQDQLAAINKVMPRSMSPEEMLSQILSCSDRGLMGRKFNDSLFRSINDQLCEDRDLSARQCAAIENTYNGYRIGEKY